jgi:putrescine aminotransferase
MPVSSFSASKEVWQCMMYPNPFIHTNTTGGNALACAAAIATIKVVLRDNLAEQAKEKGAYILSKVQ